jgi:hypothetical protein
VLSPHIRHTVLPEAELCFLDSRSVVLDLRAFPGHLSILLLLHPASAFSSLFAIRLMVLRLAVLASSRDSTCFLYGEDVRMVGCMVLRLRLFVDCTVR